MTSDEVRKLFLTRYEADRNHELELDKVAAQYELVFLQAAGILNGASATVFLSFLGSTLDKLIHVNSRLWIMSFLAWLLGLVVAIIAGSIAYRAQETVVRAIRNRRHAAGLNLLEESYRTVAGVESNITSTSLWERAQSQQSDGDRGLKTALYMGIGSVALFVLGACLALATVLTSVPMK
jgi:hypothetical protein